MLLTDLENPGHIELEEPIIKHTVRAVKFWRGRSNVELQEPILHRTVFERLDNALSVPIPDHSASDRFELVGAEFLCSGGR
jgi:hypothetical protein